MNNATLHVTIEARDLAGPALERLEQRARRARQEGGRAVRALEPSLRSLEALQRRARELNQTLGREPQGRAGLTAPLPQRYAGGGTVFPRLGHPLIASGTGTRDDVPALLMRGEFVLRRAAVRRYGLAFLHALNQERLPAQSVDLVPRFAQGGLVLPPQLVHLVPRFASGGSVAELFAKYGATSESELQAQFAAMAEKLGSRLKLSFIQEQPAAYLSSILGIVTDSLEVFKAPSSDSQTRVGAAKGASAALETQKQAINTEYAARIALARSEGNEGLADALELQRLELERIVEELQRTLADLVDSYYEQVESIVTKAESELSDLEEQAAKAKDSIWKRYRAMTEQKAGNSKGSNFFQQQEQSKATKEEQASNRSFSSKRARVTRTAQSNVRSQTRSVQREASKAESAQTYDGLEAQGLGRVELRGLYRSWLTEIQDLEIERDKALAELERSYGTLSVSGFKQFLSQGGLVGLPHFAQGGAVPARSEAWAGVARFARGGAVPAQLGTPGRDSVLAMLMPGEFVLRRDAARVLGQATLQRLNALGSGLTSQLRPLQRFAEGGAVGGGSFAAPQAQGNWGTLTIQVGGGSYPVQARQDVAEALRNELGRMARSSR